MAYVNIDKTIIIGIILCLVGMAIAVMIINTLFQVIGVVIAMAGAVIVMRRRRR
jgi:LPXTG-motif cell wall-anchored protein